MAKKKVVLPSRRPKPTGRILKPKLFTLKPETIKRLHMTIAEGSTSAFVDQAINAALDDLDIKIEPPIEGASAPQE